MPTDEQMNTVLSTYGINASSFNFSWPNLIGGFIFGVIGWYAFNYGRKERSYKPLMIGLVLMVFPYLVSNTILLYVIGVVISSLLYFWRD